jgi:predicted TPR repeat methyltransferase
MAASYTLRQAAAERGAEGSLADPDWAKLPPMATSHAIPPGVTPEAARLLERAYDLDSPECSQSLYRDWAETYDDTMLDGLGYLSPRRLAALAAEHVRDRRALILDIGCGTGLAALELARHGFSRFEGVDFSAAMLAQAQARGIYERLTQADLLQPLPMEDGRYDAAISTGTFTQGHVGADCLDEIFRVLRKGGLLACTVHLDVWQALGFEAKFAGLEARGRVRSLARREDVYYTSSARPDGYFCVFERL